LLLLARDADFFKSVSPAVAARRFVERKISSEHFSETEAIYFFDPARLDPALMQFFKTPAEYFGAKDKTRAAVGKLTSGRDVRVNTDMTPVAVAERSAYIAGIFRGSRLGAVVSGLGAAGGSARMVLLLFGLAAACSLSARYAGRRSATARTLAVYSAAAAAGFSGMLLEITLLLIFQAETGVVYRQMAVIIAVFMTGAGIGASSASMLKERLKPSVPLALVILTCAVLSAVAGRVSLGLLGICAFSFFSGLGVGGVFPASMRLLAGNAVNSGAAAGILNFSDLLGAGAGALLTGAFLIPMLGVNTTLVGACALCLCAWIALGNDA
ncbi:MAG TPA: hypothetical protein PLQ76_07705, partial [bacterium]|nr:hypothetical protein [bacterium]